MEQENIVVHVRTKSTTLPKGTRVCVTLDKFNLPGHLGEIVLLSSVPEIDLLNRPLMNDVLCLSLLLQTSIPSAIIPN